MTTFVDPRKICPVNFAPGNFSILPQVPSNVQLDVLVPLALRRKNGQEWTCQRQCCLQCRRSSWTVCNSVRRTGGYKYRFQRPIVELVDLAWDELSNSLRRHVLQERFIMLGSICVCHVG